jgi:2-polyprenyl-6-methoxyphenol hydroxylase-like FAD-dependent oxidoreductase
MRIAIIGGGIGGLSAALQLLKPGFDVHVYEQAAAIGEIGAGIQISPNASRLLVRLGLNLAMDQVGVRPLAVHQRRWTAPSNRSVTRRWRPQATARLPISAGSTGTTRPRWPRAESAHPASA